MLSIRGLLEKETIRRFALREFDDERFDHAEYLIVDLREADYSKVSERDISLVIAHTFDSPSGNPDMKLAIVATDPHVVSMCEYCQSTMSKMDMHWELRIFATMEDARAWVGA